MNCMCKVLDSMAKREVASSGERRGVRYAVLPLMLTLTLVGCESLLEVDLPGRLPASALSDPAMVDILVISAQADFECSYAGYAAFTALYTDEFITASNNNNATMISTRSSGVADLGGTSCPTTDDGQPGNYQHIQVARVAAEAAAEIIEAHAEGVVSGKERKLATLATYAGYTLTMLGEGFCEAAIDEGPVMTPAQVLALAEGKFSTAITAAQAAGAGLDDILYWASVGRARVRVELGNTQGALTDAQLVPAGFVKNATYDGTPGRRVNRVYSLNLLLRDGSVNPELRGLQVEGVPDTRLVAFDANLKGRDGSTPIWGVTRYSKANSPIPIASWEEAQLIIAEVQGGQGTVDAINRLRDAANLPRFSSTDPVEIRAELLSERRRVLFGQGQRISDLIRFPELSFPTGVNHKNQPYLNNTCMPLPTVERDANPNIG